jgi:hypothetical protein
MTSWLIVRAFSLVGLATERFDYRTLAAEHGEEKMNEMLRKVIQDLPGGSLVLVIKGELISPLVFMGRWNLRRALWFWDFNAKQPFDWLYKIGRWMSAVFLICRPWVEELRDAGINAFFMPQATDSTVYRPVAAKKQCDVVFIGTRKPGREEILKTLMKHFNVEVWGEQWKNTEFKPGTPAYLEKFNEVCSHSKILLNITASPEWPLYEQTFSQRIYMAASCGACVLTERIPGMENFFLPNRELIEYHPFGLVDLISKLLSDEDKLIEIGKAARRRVLMQHQYIHRLRRMFECLGLSLSVLRHFQA